MSLKSSSGWRLAVYHWPGLQVKTVYIYAIEKVPLHPEFAEKEEYLKHIIKHNIEC